MSLPDEVVEDWEEIGTPSGSNEECSGTHSSFQIPLIRIEVTTLPAGSRGIAVVAHTAGRERRPAVFDPAGSSGRMTLRCT